MPDFKLIDSFLTVTFNYFLAIFSFVFSNNFS